MSYIRPSMKTTFQGHKLKCLCDTEHVQVYLMHKEGTGVMRVQLSFTPEGIHITGDVGLGRDQSGISTIQYKPLGWFANPSLGESPGYLCSKFLTKQLQQECMVEDARRQADDYARDATDSPSEHAKLCFLRAGQWLAFAQALEGCDNIHDAAACLWEHYSRMDDPDVFEGFGMDYPREDAGWLCAIQARFAELYGAHQQASVAQAKVTEQSLWDAYRVDPRNRPLLEAAGVAGPDDLEAALTSSFEVAPADGEDPPVLLRHHVLHTLAVFAQERQGRG